LQALEQVVERSSELGELVVWAADAQTPAQVRGGDLLSGRRDRAQWAQEAAGEPPRARQGDDRGDETDDRGTNVERPPSSGCDRGRHDRCPRS
jgi:hypothetical protein